MKPRLGRVCYINCEPVYYGIEKGVVPAYCQILDGTPAELNEMLKRGELDLSVVSSIEYARHHQDYLLLPELAIAANGPVGSVLFFSRVPINRLQGQKVLLTKSSLTSIYLIKILLGKAHNVSPIYLHDEVVPERLAQEDIQGVLLIGDEALRTRARGRFPYVLDLGADWKELTGLPFIFALWAVREEYYRKNKRAVKALHQSLLASKAYSLAHLDEICDAVYDRVGMRKEDCYDYLHHNLSFDLTERHLEGFLCFLTMVETQGESGNRREAVTFRFI
ncbi:MAG: menaquinone biosynthesis protein [candidate division NC10 bacterium]|nr:menaquinone biosynthesis protein [candidate division NC10 bacterium]